MLIKQTRDSYAVWYSLITSNRLTEVCYKDSKCETLGEKKKMTKLYVPQFTLLFEDAHQVRGREIAQVCQGRAMCKYIF